MTTEAIHTCSYSCERPECIRAQRDELAARLTAETSNARGEWPERYACNGPEGTFWTDDAALANKLIAAAFDRDEWTVTDTQNPTGATPPQPADARGDVRGLVDKLVDAAYQDGMQELDAMSNETLSARSALEQALSQQPAAVDEAMVERALRAWREAVVVHEGNKPAIRAALTAALAAQHQEPKS